MENIPTPPLRLAEGITKSIPFWGSALFLVVWIGMEVALGTLTSNGGFNTNSRPYHFAVTFSSLIISYLVGGLAVNRATMEARVQAKYEDIMNHLTIKNGTPVFLSEVSGIFSPSELRRLPAIKHMNLLEVSMMPVEAKLKELIIIRESLNAVDSPLEYAEVCAWIGKKLQKLGRTEEAIQELEQFIKLHDEIDEHALGIVQAQLARALKQVGRLDDSIETFLTAMGNIPKHDLFRSMAAKKDYLRAVFRRQNDFGDIAILYEIHDALLAMIQQSNDGSETFLHTWRINCALESYYDLSALFQSANGQHQWAARYAFAATILSEVRCGNQHSSYSMGHLARILLEVGELESSRNFIENTRKTTSDLSTLAMLNYNEARCLFASGDYQEALYLFEQVKNDPAASSYAKLHATAGVYHVLSAQGSALDAEVELHAAKKLASKTGFFLDLHLPTLDGTTEQTPIIDHAHLPDVEQFLPEDSPLRSPLRDERGRFIKRKRS
jgi:tetratricopeptide (TPR) repeat protein